MRQPPALTQALSQRCEFDSLALQEFLKSGWFLSLAATTTTVAVATATDDLDSQQILVGWGEPQFVAAPARGPDTASLFAPDFHLRGTAPWMVTPYWDLVSRDRLASLVLAGVTRDVNCDVACDVTRDVNGEDQRFHWVEPDLSNWQERFAEIKRRMNEGGLKKAVPVVFAEAQGSVDETRRLMILRSLMKLPRSLLLYGIWGTRVGRAFGMIGATPEVLFTESADGTLETMALAGTRAKALGSDCHNNNNHKSDRHKNDDDEAAALLADPKERYEHQLVVDDIRAVLASLGDVTVGETGVAELPTLYHLKTPIRVRLRKPVDVDMNVNMNNVDMDMERIARLLHPTPALGVAPRELGFAEILTWDDVEIRERFGAPFGVSADVGDRLRIRQCVVAIRNIQWQDQRIRLGSGCGVVPESDPAREWNELRLKRESVKRMLSV